MGRRHLTDVVGILGSTLTTLIYRRPAHDQRPGLQNTRTLDSWARGGQIEGLDAGHRLQVLYRVTSAIEEAFTPAVAAAFLRGSNPLLGGRAPLLVLADDPLTEAEPRLVAAVEAFLTA